MPRPTLRAAGVILLGGVAGCDAPQAWTDYTSPTYSVLDEETLTQSSSLAIQVKGSVGGLPPGELHGLIHQVLNVPPTAADTASANSDRRIVWTLSGGIAGQATTARASAEYYRDGTLMSSAEGMATLPQGAADPNLRTLLADVAGQLFPPIRHRGGGRS